MPGCRTISSGPSRAAPCMSLRTARKVLSATTISSTPRAGVVGSWQGVDRATLTQWRNAAFTDAYSLFGDPLFVDVDGADGQLGFVDASQDGRDDDFHLQSLYGSYHGGSLRAGPGPQPGPDPRFARSLWAASGPRILSTRPMTRRPLARHRPGSGHTHQGTGARRRLHQHRRLWEHGAGFPEPGAVRSGHPAERRRRHSAGIDLHDPVAGLWVCRQRDHRVFRGRWCVLGSWPTTKPTTGPTPGRSTLRLFPASRIA